MEARRIVLKGRVQGVGFRYFVLRQAQRFPVAGWVRNLNDGDVEVHAQGDGDVLNRFVAAIAGGPPGALVTEAQERKAEPEHVQDFRIKGW